MALGEHRPIDLADEKQYLCEMVMIIVDRKDRQLHRYRHLQSLSPAAQILMATDRQVCRSGDLKAPFSRASARVDSQGRRLEGVHSQSAEFYLCSRAAACQASEPATVTAVLGMTRSRSMFLRPDDPDQAFALGDEISPSAIAFATLSRPAHKPA
jgi:hypothetical protein